MGNLLDDDCNGDPPTGSQKNESGFEFNFNQESQKKPTKNSNQLSDLNDIFCENKQDLTS